MLRSFVSKPRLRSPRADVVVIGGGIVGVFLSYSLVLSGLKLVLVEKSLIGTEQASRN